MTGPRDVDWWRRVFRGTTTVFATLLSVGWLLLLALLVAGFVVGPAPPEDPPSIDADDPPATVAANALAQLDARDHTLERWLYRENATTGAVSGGILYRITIEHSAGEVRVRNYPGALASGEWTTPSAYSYRFFGTRIVKYQRIGDGPWRRVVGGGFVYDKGARSLARYAPAVRRANVTVATENATHLVLSITESRVVDRFAGFSPARNVSDDTVRLVVRKGSTPHLQRAVYRGRTDDGVYRERHVIRNFGSAEARPPDGVPGTGASDAIARTVLGVERIVDLVA